MNAMEGQGLKLVVKMVIHLHKIFFYGYAGLRWVTPGPQLFRSALNLTDRLNAFAIDKLLEASLQRAMLTRQISFAVLKA